MKTHNLKATSHVTFTQQNFGGNIPSSLLLFYPDQAVVATSVVSGNVF